MQGDRSRYRRLHIGNRPNDQLKTYICAIQLDRMEHTLTAAISAQSVSLVPTIDSRNLGDKIEARVHAISLNSEETGTNGCHLRHSLLVSRSTWLPASLESRYAVIGRQKTHANRCIRCSQLPSSTPKIGRFSFDKT
jgi:hypothetical protein